MRTPRPLRPRTTKSAVAAIPAKGRPSPLPNGLKVLLVEDNEQVRDFAAELLRDLDCEVESAADGKEALEKVRDGGFDLVFSDVVMPGLTGLQLAQAIEQEWPDLPVLLATGYSQELAGERGLRFKVVAKPYDATTLSGAIASVLETERAA